LILLVYAHPHHERSVANRALLDAVRGVPGLTLHALYDRYPDFSIDVAREQALLSQAQAVVWQHPLYWYTAPALLKLWFEVVLTRGWAYGDGGTALAGKRCLWVTTVGAPDAAYDAEGVHGHPLTTFGSVIAQTARFCGMQWDEPIVVHDAHHVGEAALQAQAKRYRARLRGLAQGQNV
jgi:glutathione-regulated potassium-efflux system ancillary protein KefF